MIPSPVSAMQTSAPAVRYSRNQNRHDNNRRRERESGPPVTVFIGNIMDRAPDVMIRHILGACGHVLSWKRVQAFGFCEYAGPDAGLRAVRLLHDMEIGTKKLVVKVDAKAKVVLDQFKGKLLIEIKTKMETLIKQIVTFYSWKKKETQRWPIAFTRRGTWWRNWWRRGWRLYGWRYESGRRRCTRSYQSDHSWTRCRSRNGTSCSR